MAITASSNFLRDQIARLSSVVRTPSAFRLISRVRRRGLTYLNFSALYDLYRQIESQNRSTAGINPIYIEAGSALGGSAIVMAAAKTRRTPLYLYDTFEMIPAPSARDGADAHERFDTIARGQATGIKGETYYGYRDNLLEQVTDAFLDFGFDPEEENIHFVKGLFEETLRIDSPVALAHIDCDWYESVMVCLEAIEPWLIQGGVLVIDDYFDWSGCRRAVDEYFADKKERYRFVTRSRLHIERIV